MANEAANLVLGSYTDFSVNNEKVRITTVNSLPHLAAFLTHLQKSVYQQGANNTLGTHTIVFSNPMVRITLARYRLEDNPCVSFASQRIEPHQSRLSPRPTASGP